MATSRFLPGYGVVNDYGAAATRFLPGYGVVTDSDGIPAAFTFTDATGVAASTVSTSNTVTITGIDTSVTVSFSTSGGTDHEYSKNGGAWTAVGNTTAVDGDTLAVRLTSNATALGAAAITMTAGGVSDTYTVTTEAEAATTPPVVPADGSDYRIPGDEARQRQRAEAAQPDPEPTPEAIAAVKEIVRDVARTTARDTAERRHAALMARLEMERAELNAAYLAMLETDRQALELEAIAAWEREQMLLDDEDAILLFMV
jgi:hypothetical protein